MRPIHSPGVLSAQIPIEPLHGIDLTLKMRTCLLNDCIVMLLTFRVLHTDEEDTRIYEF